MPRRAGSMWAAPLAFAALLAAGSAQASGLQVAPVSVTLTAAESSDGLTLSNVGDAPLHAQVRVYRWLQDDGDSETLEPTSDVVVSPPMVALQPGGQQLVRLVRAGVAPSVGAPETAYRIVVDELPVAAESAPGGLAFVLRYSLPVFMLPAGPETRPELDWNVVERDGAIALEVANGGGKHAQVADVALIDAEGNRTVLASGLLGYALPGASRTWATAVPWSPSVPGGTLEVRINGQVATVPVAGPSR